MLVGFYTMDGKFFLKHIPIPLPPIYKIPLYNSAINSMLSHQKGPPEVNINYREFELAMRKAIFPEFHNVIGLPHAAYKEVKRGQ